MIKKIILSAITIGFVTCFIFVGNMVLQNHISYLENKREVNKYVRDTYSSVEYIRAQKGESPWKASRTDKFIFYDKNEQFYFRLLCTNKIVSDCYEEAYLGNSISKCIRDHFANTSINFLIETFVYSDGTTAGNYSCVYSNLVLFSNTQELILKEVFDVLSFLLEKYPFINITVRVSDIKYSNEYNNFFEYKRNFAIDSIPYIYRGNISNTYSINFANIQELLSLWEF